MTQAEPLDRIDAAQIERVVRSTIAECGESMVSLNAACGFGSRATLYNLLKGRPSTREARNKLLEGLGEIMRKHGLKPKYLVWDDLLSNHESANRTVAPDPEPQKECSFDEASNIYINDGGKDVLRESIRILKAAAQASGKDQCLTSQRSALLAACGLLEQLGRQDVELLEALLMLLQVEKEIGDIILQSRTLSRAAWVAYRLGRMTEAKLYSSDAMRTLEAEDLGSNPEVRTWLKALDCYAMVLAHEGRHREAIARLEESLEKRMYLECPLLKAATLYRLGRVYAIAGDFEKSCIKFDASFRIRKRYGAIEELAKTALHWSEACLKADRHADAAIATESYSNNPFGLAAKKQDR